MDFDYEGGRGKGGNVTLSVNGKKVGKGRIERTEPNAFYADDLAVVGVDEEHMLVKPTMIMETSLRAKLRKSGWTLNKSLSVRLNSFK